MILCIMSAASFGVAQTVELIKYGDFENWITRNIHESRVLGGKVKQVYEIGPEEVMDNSKPYSNKGGSPWATSNVMANVMGVVKGSNAVFPDKNPSGGRCCMMTTIIEKVQVLGLVNLKVLVAGSIYLGYNIEPIRNASNPYSKMEMGVPFSRRPKALRYDYKVEIPEGARRMRATGTSSKQLEGSDNAEVYILLQRRWEDSEGNIYAKRVGTGRGRYGPSCGWYITATYRRIPSTRITWVLYRPTAAIMPATAEARWCLYEKWAGTAPTPLPPICWSWPRRAAAWPMKVLPE